MKLTTTQCLSETWQPTPTEIPVGSLLVKEGETLPRSVTEDVGGFSLHPTYSKKQCRRIHRIRIHSSQREWNRKTAKFFAKEKST
jgi:hypothetical protein